MKIQKLVALRRVRRALRTRSGLASGRYRLTLFVSCKHIYAQLIDDVNATTLVFANSCEKVFSDSGIGSNVRVAASVGRLIGERAVGYGVQKVAFDRGSRRYHGVVSAFADSARAAGLEF